MKKLLLFLIGVSLLSMFALDALAKIGKMPKNYIYTNRRYDYVKLEKFKGKDYKGVTANHPYTFTEDQMKGILASLKLDRKQFMVKEIQKREMFDDTAICFLAPYLVQAFEQASPEQRVIVSYVSKEPFFVIRNDRLTAVSMWVGNDGLHMRFGKVFAKMMMDTDKMGYDDRKFNRALGARVHLDPVEGQELVASDELVINLAYNFILTKPLEPDVKAKQKRVFISDKSKKAEAQAEAEKLQYEKDRSLKERMTELDNLYKDKLIAKEDYEQKKKELLQQL